MPTRDKTTAEIADIFDVQTRSVTNWAKRGCPHDPPANRKQSMKFDESEVAAWMQANGITGDIGRPAEESNDELKALKARKELALVLRYERENSVADGKLIDAVEEQQRDVAKVTAARHKLGGLGSSLAPQLAGLDASEIQTLIDSEIERVLDELSTGR